MPELWNQVVGEVPSVTAPSRGPDVLPCCQPLREIQAVSSPVTSTPTNLRLRPVQLVLRIGFGTEPTADDLHVLPVTARVADGERPRPVAVP
jgi:hypothetical protein